MHEKKRVDKQVYSTIDRSPSNSKTTLVSPPPHRLPSLPPNAIKYREKRHPVPNTKQTKQNTKSNRIQQWGLKETILQRHTRKGIQPFPPPSNPLFNLELLPPLACIKLPRALLLQEDQHTPELAAEREDNEREQGALE